MGLFNRAKPAPADPRIRQGVLKAVVPASEFKDLGTSPGQMYVTRGGVEFVIDTRGTGTRDGADLAVHPGDLIVATPLRETLSDGEVFTTTVYRRAARVAVGTYAAVMVRNEARRTKQAVRDRRFPVDVHSVIPRVVQGTSEVAIAAVGRAPTFAIDRLVAPPDLFGNRPSAPYFPPTPAPESPAAIVAWYGKRGVTLTVLPDGRLLVEAKNGRVSRVMLDDIRADQRRLVAHLSDRWPQLCERHPDRPAHDAVRTYAIDVLGCDE